MSQLPNKAQISILKLNISHLEDIHALEVASFSLPWSKQAYRAELAENPLAHYYGCFSGAKLIAFVGLWQIVDEGHICNVAVHPDWRGHGVGELLLRHLVAMCHSWGNRSITLEVRESNVPALALYQKLGFYQVGHRPHYYADNGEAALLLWLDL